LPLVVVTFHPHPLSVVRPGTEPQQLATIRHRVELLSSAGADAVNLLEFTEELSQTEPKEWVEQTLVAMPARAVLVGEDFRFGHLAAGDTDLLRQLGQQYGFDVVTVPLLGDQNSGRAWSSSLIREAITAGDMPAARSGLGRNHVVEGLVVHGDHRGRDLGYPTANINPLAAGYGGPVAMPADGVYAGWLVVNPHQPGTTHLPAAISVGRNPTFEDQGERRVEAYVLDQEDLSLYDHLVAIEFAERLRDQIAFDAAEPLQEQMASDVEQTRALLVRAQHN
jgi:riboflavin kinase/FMN adenylyltransferase